MIVDDSSTREDLTLGCIADDFTGATDLANNLARAGMRTIVTNGIPDHDKAIAADAVVIALKSRTIPAADAVAQSLAACRWLRGLGAPLIYFKVCSTFDSTPRGNIGPVIEALMDELHCEFTLVVPAFPDNERTVFRGHLFVGDVLLSESGMRNHPLTPMTDANLVRVLQAQMHERRIGLVDRQITGQSAEAIRLRMNELQSLGVSIAIADAIDNDDLVRLAVALQDAPLVTASSGLGVYLPGVWGFHPTPAASRLPAAQGRRAIISGSCSTATNAQVQRFLRDDGAAFALAPETLAVNAMVEIENALAWADTRWSEDASQPLLIYSTAKAKAVKAAHVQLGVKRAGALVEEALASIVQGMVQRGAGRLIVAGGETAGVCVQALDIRRLQIGPQIDPGVPWCYATSPLSPASGLHITLKSGNFGAEDFFERAFAELGRTQ